MQKYITNIDTTMQEAIHKVSESKKIDILVGYVYFSGFHAIMSDREKRKDFFEKPMRILVGMQIDSRMATEYYNYTHQKNTLSLADRRRLSQEQMQIMLNSEEFDDKATLELFMEKIQNGTLEIRQTKEPAHAKIYIFQTCEDPTEDTYHKGIVITGSSNLTQSGLQSQTEFNVVLEDTDAFDTARKVFETLWEDSIAVLNKAELELFKTKVGLLNKPTPYEVYLKVLCEYFEYAQKDQQSELVIMPSGGNSLTEYVDLAYQVDAIKEAMHKVRTHNGVIIADVVGLGKTITATCLAKNLEEYGNIDKTLIISPPHLKQSWETYAGDFNLNYKTYSSGKLDPVLQEVKNAGSKKFLIIVDEAHRFRNDESAMYADLYKICYGNKVVLLSATPFNNTAADIFSLLQLFQNFNNASIDNYQNIIPKIQNILLEQKELKKDEELNKEKLQELSKKISKLIDPVFIRRTRTDLLETKRYKKDLDNQKIELNKVKDPKIHEYQLSGELSTLFTQTFNKINPQDDTTVNQFKGTRYKATQYIKAEYREEIRLTLFGENSDVSKNIFDVGAKNMSLFMRRLLVRRFESSVNAFKKSVDNIINSYENIKSWLDNDYLPIYKKGSVNFDEVMLDKDLFAPTDEDEEDGDEEDGIFDKAKLDKFKNKGLMYITGAKEKLDKKFFTDFERDLEVLYSIKNEWQNVTEDPKFDYIFTQTKKLLQKDSAKKIIIFSEFADTALYLQEKFTEHNNSRTISFTAADKKEKKEQILQNFDAGRKNLKDEFDILITTDTLSEGVNLHKAGIIVNYDIPYNPTRVIQRIGRINRIGKKSFDELEIHNYIPRIETQKEVTSWGISQFKIALINAIFGGDTKTLTSEEDLTAAFDFKKDEKSKNPEEKSWDIDYKNDYNDLTENKELYKRIKKLPPRLELSVKKDFEGIAEIIRTGDLLSCRVYNKSTNEKSYSTEEAFKHLKCIDETVPYENVTEHIKELKIEVRKLPEETNSKKSNDSIRDLKKHLTELKKSLSEEDFEYLELLAEVGEKLPKHDLDLLKKVKIIKVTDSIIENIQEKIPLQFLKRLKNSYTKSNSKKPQLLVTEEFVV